MIELLLEANRQLTVGQLDAAERLYWQAIERDPRNAIAVTGLAQVALERGDDRTALSFGRKALELDGQDAIAARLVARLEEVMANRGEDLPAHVPGTPMGRSPYANADMTPEQSAEPPADRPAQAPPPAGKSIDPTPVSAVPARQSAPRKRSSLLRRLFGGG